MLLMKKAYFDAIRRGEKTTTLRYWQRRQVRAGSVHRVRGLGAVRIVDVRRVEFDELTETDARVDGFDSLAALREALEAMYTPTQRRQRELYRVEFTWLGDEVPHLPTDEPPLR